MHVPTRRTGLLAAAGVLTAATVLVGGVQQGASGQPTAGSCVDRDARPAPCSAPAAVYQVLTVARSASADGSACPRGDYFEHPGGPGTLCLGWNAAAGDCIEDDPEGPSFVACAPAARRPTFQVRKVLDGRASAKACAPLGPTVAALTYSVPAKTLCITHLPIVSE